VFWAREQDILCIILCPALVQPCVGAFLAHSTQSSDSIARPMWAQHGSGHFVGISRGFLKEEGVGGGQAGRRLQPASFLVLSPVMAKSLQPCHLSLLQDSSNVNSIGHKSRRHLM
jgi:hypothetical protein